MKTIRTTALALAACAALLSGYAATSITAVNAAPESSISSKRSPIPKPRQKGCVARRALEIKSLPNTKSAVIGSIPSGTVLRVRARVGSWFYVNGGGRAGWTKGGVVCRR